MRRNVLLVLMSPWGYLRAESAAVTPQLASQQMLLVSISLDHRSMTDTLPVYPWGERFFLPLGEFCKALTLGVRVDAEKGCASGFIIDEKRHFALDLTGGAVWLQGQRHALAAHEGVVKDGDIYVDVACLNRWFPLQVQVLAGEARLVVKAKEKLPLQAQWEREQRLLAGEQSAQKPDQWLSFPYHFLAIPVVDQTLSFFHDTTSGRRPGVASTTTLSGDCLWMSANAYLDYDDRAKRFTGRGLLFREDPTGHLLGPLGARTVALGDISLPAADGWGQGGAVQGGLVSSFPHSGQSLQHEQFFLGPLPPGWSVELLQNGALMGFQQAKADGFYRFDKVPLRFGLNDFQLIFHGPEGQVRRESHRLDAAAMQPRQGEVFYKLAGGRARHLAHGAPVGISPWRGMGEVQYGLSQALACSVGWYHTGSHGYWTGGLQGMLPFLNFQSGFTQRADGGEWGWKNSLKSGYGLATFGVQREDYGGKSPIEGLSMFPRGRSGPLRYRQSADAFSAWSWGPLGLQAGLTLFEERIQKDARQGGVALNLSGTHQRWMVNHQWQRAVEEGRGTAIQKGILRCAYEGEEWSGRGEWEYTWLSSRLRTHSLQWQGEWRPDTPSLWQLTLTRQYHPHAFQSQLAYYRFQGTLGMGLQLSHHAPGGVCVTASLHAALGREPRTGRWAMRASPLGSQGLISAAAFVDANGNGKRDPEEAWIEGVNYQVNGSLGEKLLETPQVAFLGNGGRYAPTVVTLAMESVEDPYLKPLHACCGFLPRPGAIIQLDFPLVAFGEICGTIRCKDDPTMREAPGIELELISDAGLCLQRQTSAFDGFFDFAQVPPGRYALRLAKRLEAMGWRLAEPVSLVLPATGNVLEGLDVWLTRP